MCGIAAVWRRDGSSCSPDELLAVRDTLVHRGPDDAGVYFDGAVGLGHRRLSILDLSPAGHQPMTNEDGSVWLTFNGEIYNYLELASELRARGHQFRSATDSEVILHLYEEYGERCVERLNGMFAFVIWDARQQRMFAARDRMGIKPFYYHCRDQLFVAASEAKAVLAHPEVRTAVDPQGLADYLFVGAPLGEKTMFADVRQLPPAHTLTITRERVVLRRYWDVAYRYQSGRAHEALVDELHALVDDAVRIHCRSDAAVGCHLSGGLDSSLVAAVAARHRGAMDAFSVRFGEGAFYDELHYAKAVAEAIGARHHLVSPTAEDLLPVLGPLTWHQDFPLTDAGGFSYFSVSRLAAESVRVAMTGHGGDEVFGGYPAQFQATFGTTEMFDLSKRPTDPPESFARKLGKTWRRRGLLGLAARLRPARRPEPSFESQWIALHCGSTPEQHPFLHPKMRDRFGGYSPATDFLKPLREAPTDHTFDRCLYHDLTSYLPQLLMKEDRTSMAVSIESRVPLLDYRIIELMATVPPDEKIPGRVPKALLRAVARREVPKQVVDRDDKTPFPVPLREWIARDLGGPLRALLRSPRSLERGIFDPRVLRDPSLDAGELLALANVEIWFRVHIDRDPEWRPRAVGALMGPFASLPGHVA